MPLLSGVQGGFVGVESWRAWSYLLSWWARVQPHCVVPRPSCFGQSNILPRSATGHYGNENIVHMIMVTAEVFGHQELKRWLYHGPAFLGQRWALRQMRAVMEELRE